MGNRGGPTHGNHEDRSGKRVGHRAPDSAVTTKDLHTGERSSLVSWSDNFISHTDILLNTHSNIPPPPALGRVSMTSPTDRPPVSELNNHYSILPIEETNDSSVDDRVVRAPPKLTKCPASNSSRAKASNEKMTTISSPILTVPHQSRPPLREFQAAVTNAQPDGVKECLTLPTRKPFRTTANCPGQWGMQGKHQKF